ncbi:virulence factor TspB C-terminal domain-related protein [Acinetobacter thermotolerans]|uniref:virulence factor TspB C-terminal domain-related protein n=1 Tax=Acinetobacter thermotolerans TaxID=3151487 RepID=UPI00325A6E51
MIHRINVFLLSLIVALAPIYASAITTKDQQKWQLQQLKRLAESITGLPSDGNGKRLAAQLAKETTVSGTKKTTYAIVETKPTATKVGTSMMKRLYSSAGGRLIGVAAVVELIEAIGWVMEDGKYVKKFVEEQEGCPTCEKVWRVPTRPTQYAETAVQACTIYASSLNYNGSTFTFYELRDVQLESVTCNSRSNLYPDLRNWDNNTMIYKVDNPNYDPEARQNEKTVPLTPALLGAAMLGKGYSDPDPNFDNSRVNTDDWTGVEDAYRPDDTGIGNELYEGLEDKADRAPKTTDGKPSQIGDPRYQNPLDDSEDANDRAWDGEGVGEDGSKGKTENTDPNTGEKTSEGTFQLPRFCDWAPIVCDWIDWTQKDDELPDPDEPDEIIPDIAELDTSVFRHVPGCPDPIVVPGSGLFESFTISYDPICHFASKWSFVAPLIGFLSGAMIIIGVGRKGEDSDV